MARVLGLGTSLAGEFTARGFVVINFGVAIGMLGEYVANRHAQCQRPFAAWLLVQGVLGVALGVYAFVLLSRPWLEGTCGVVRVVPQQAAAAPTRRSVKLDVGLEEVQARELRCFAAVRGSQDSLLTTTYAAMFTWLVIGGVWFFDSEPVDAGRCAQLRRFGLGYTAAVFLLLALCLVIGLATSCLPEVQAAHGASPRTILVGASGAAQPKSSVEDPQPTAVVKETSVRGPSMVLLGGTRPQAQSQGFFLPPRPPTVSDQVLKEAADKGIDTVVPIHLPVHRYVQALSMFSSSTASNLVAPYNSRGSPQRLHVEEL